MFETAHEGGYTNHPSDPGGPTNFGITIADYRRYVKRDGSAADVRAMRIDEARAIYRARYWNAMRCDELTAGVDYALFDYGVNSGTSRAVKVLQRLLGIADDGRMTDAAIAAVAKRNAADLVTRLCDERLAFLKGLKTWPVFGAGWGRRVAEVKTAALAMAAQARSAPKSAPALGKGTVPANASARAGVAGAIAALGAALAHVAHHAGAHPAATVAILLVTAALALGGWFAWRWLQQRHKESN